MIVFLFSQNALLLSRFTRQVPLSELSAQVGKPLLECVQQLQIIQNSSAAFEKINNTAVPQPVTHQKHHHMPETIMPQLTVAPFNSGDVNWSRKEV